MDTAGNFTYTPVADFVGADTFAYTITDADGDESTATVTVNVANVNKLADAVDDSFEMDENTQITGSLLDNDDLGDEATTVTDFDDVSVNGATVTVDTAGNFTYTPVADFVGADTFTYTITDADGDESTATVTVDVANVNKLADAVDDSFEMDENTQLTGILLDNDDLGDEATTVTDFDDVSVNGATVTVDTAGNFVYTPVTDFIGEDTFTYSITDADGDESTATVTVDVANVNKLADAVDDSFEMDENTQLTGILLDNDDLGDEATTVTDFDDVSVNGATVTVDTAGNFVYTPVTDFIGEDTFTYSITDADGDESKATVTVDVANVNKLPEAVDDSFIINENTTLNNNVIGNDELGDPLTTVTPFNITAASGRTVSMDANGNFNYSPAPNFTGTDTFNYTITDADGDTSTATVSVIVNDVPVVTVDLLPNAVDDTYAISENTTLNSNVLGNDNLGDQATTATPFTVITDSGGTGEMEANGNFRYEPSPDFFGTETFEYTITDADGDTSTATVTVNVNEEQDRLPDAVDDTFAIDENTTLTENVLGNDDLGDPATTVTPFSITTANGGSVSMGTTGVFSYTPALGFTGDDTFAYTITDSDGDPSSATVTVNVNDLPVAVDDTFAIDENTTLTENVLGNDDLGDPITTVTPFSITTADGGSVSMGTTGDFSYTPAPGFTGDDTFAYTITDSDGDPSSATVTVNVNDLPDAADDTFDMVEGTTLSGNIIGNDDQGDGLATVTHIKGGNVTFDLNFDAADDDYATFTIIDGVYTAVSSTDVLIFDGATDNGILRINAVGQFTYENKGFLADSDAPTFEYTLSDGIDIDTAIVTIEVNATSPEAFDDETEIAMFHRGGTETSSESFIIGNVVADGSFTDAPDQSDNGFGPPPVTSVTYNGQSQSFVGDDPIIIDTGFGILTIENTGEYLFVVETGTTLPTKPIETVEFTYTIQDADLVSKETDEGVLTITVTPTLEAETQKAPEPSAKSFELDLDETSGTINTDFDAKALINVDESGFVYSPSTYDLSDILTDGQTGGLETYFAAMGEDESAMVDIDLAVALKDFQVDDSVVLQKGDANSEHASFTTVTNGFLSDGAIIISDTAEATNAPIAELDSQEFLS